MRSKSKTIGGVLLVSGTTIGGAVLALPISTGLVGFGPSLILFAFTWLYLFYSALLLLEMTLWMGGETNIVSMAKRTLGNGGRIVTWVIYLFLLYALNTVYISASSDILNHFLGLNLPRWGAAIPVVILFGIFIYRGMQSVDFINRIFMSGLTFAFLILTLLVIPHVDQDRLSHSNWSYTPMAVSVIATAFGYHIIIPSLSTYMGGHAGKLKKVLLIGTLIPLGVYCIWEFATLGVLPVTGENSVTETFDKGIPVTMALSALLKNRWINVFTRLFEICAVVTSVLGVSLSLSDFLADGLKIHKSPWGKFLLCILTFVPPFLISVINPRAFFTALEYAGIFGVVILLVIMPALMVWQARYTYNKESGYTAPGGKIGLILTIAVSLGIIALEVIRRTTMA